MPIGASVTTNVPTVGTTLLTLTKAKDGAFSLLVGDVQTTLNMSSANTEKQRTSASLTLRRNPTLSVAPASNVSGKLSANASLSFTLGTVVTRTAAREFLQEFAGILCQASVIDALVEGSLE